MGAEVSTSARAESASKKAPRRQNQAITAANKVDPFSGKEMVGFLFFFLFNLKQIQLFLGMKYRDDGDRTSEIRLPSKGSRRKDYRTICLGVLLW